MGGMCVSNQTQNHEIQTNKNQTDELILVVETNALKMYKTLKKTATKFNRTKLQQQTQVQTECSEILLEDLTIYKGQWLQAMKHGNGLLVFPTGKYYEGEFSYDIIQGNGIMYVSEDEEYQGQWVEGLFEGYGKLRCPDFQYEGQFYKGKFQGKGEIQFLDGTQYVGDFENGFRHGEGVIQYPDGVKEEGYFEFNELIKQYTPNTENLNEFGH